MSSSKRFPRRLEVVGRESAPDAAIEEIRGLLDGYLEPAVVQLRTAVAENDVVAIRVYAFELLAMTGTVVAACPRPPSARG